MNLGTFLVEWLQFLQIKSFCFGFLKVEKGGEDAFFVSRYNGGVVAVADGVSGYTISF